MANGTITTGGTAQNLFAADPGRSGILALRNNSAERLWVEIGGTAAVDGGLPIEPGEYWESPGRVSAALSILGATTGSKFWYHVFGG